MEINKIYVADCFDLMQEMVDNNIIVDNILTSPPYCTPNDDARNYNEKRFKNYQVHYDVFNGFDSTDEYRKWTVDLFNKYDLILKNDGCVLYNISYTASYPELVYLCIYDIIQNTNFTVVDCISWKKKSALPQNMNKNRATRVCEFVFVLCRKSEVLTFKTNKVSLGGGKFKNLFYNFIEAKNNDILDTDINKLNSATFSTDLVLALLNMYVSEGELVYDSFMGTGTTAVACKMYGCDYIGSELSEEQVKFANLRLLGLNKLYNPKLKKLF